MPRPSNTEPRRQQIVDGLLCVMAEKSYEKATIASIARAAKLTPGVVHYHFNSKQEILLELTRQLAEKLSRRYQSLTGDGSPQARLNAFIATGPGSDPRAVACWVAVGTEASRQEEVGEIYRRVMGEQLEELSEILAPMLESQARRREAAVAILAAIEGCYQVATAAPGLAPAGFGARSVKAMAVGLIDA